MTFLEFAWLVPLFPLLAFLLITLTPIRRSRTASGWLAIALVVAAAVVALGVASEVARGIVVGPESVAGISEAAAEAGEDAFVFPGPNIVRTFRWAPAGDQTFTMGYYVDPAVAAMLVMVTITSACIHLFSLGYMAHDERQARFFSFVALFTSAMLLMLLASNLLLFFMAWEVMGLCSYLLIGFWYDKRYPNPRQITPRQAAVKAFITTRVGDALLLVGLAYLWTEAGSLDFGSGPGQIFDPAFLTRIAAQPAALGLTTATAIALLIFAGTVGKSAQFPLHVWLPDAMEGPTPVSALIHAATMVAAGVFLVARTYPIFEASESARQVVAVIGATTALGAALVALAQFDLKRILAYSTLSQLGFMVAALGIGGWVAALFHLLTHAFFKALLFLGAGSVIHGMEATVGHDSNTAQDIRNMGGLRRFMPWTFGAYLVGALALAGVPGLSGFWSKDEILADAFNHGHLVVWAVLTLASLLTAFYMTRQVALVFFGPFRGGRPRLDTRPSEPTAVVAPGDGRRETGDEGQGEGAAEEEAVISNVSTRPASPTPQVSSSTAHASSSPAHHDPHESPWTMVVPLVALAVFAALAGFVNTPFNHWLSDFFGQEAGKFNPLVAGLAILVAAAGIGLGWALYRNAFASAQDADPLERRLPGVFGLLNRRLLIDEFYAGSFGRLADGLAFVWSWLDQRVLGRLVSGVGGLTLFLGRVNFILDDLLLNDGGDKLAEGTVAGGDGIRRAETGKIQDYAALIFVGVVLLGVVYLYAFRG